MGIISEKVFICSYFWREWKVLSVITISGLIYNLGLLAGPWFEGRMTGCLVQILNGTSPASRMLTLVCAYVASIAVMQPLYRVLSMTGVLFIFYFGGKNVLGQGWSALYRFTGNNFIAKNAI